MTSDDRIVEISLAGELDIARSEELRRKLAPAETAYLAVIDMRGVTYLDSTAITCFVRLRKRMSENGHTGTVRIKSPSLQVHRILTMCGLSEIFVIEAPIILPPG
jgi:anti-anti-sigma factor